MSIRESTDRTGTEAPSLVPVPPGAPVPAGTPGPAGVEGSSPPPAAPGTAPAVPGCARAASSLTPHGAGTQTPAGGAPDGASVPAAGTAWRIEMPAGLALLSLNDRLHWSARNRTYQSLKKAAWAMTLNAQVPPLERVTIKAVYDPPDRRRRDADNISASVKALIDGIVAAGRLRGDDSRYVASVSCEIGKRVYPLGRFVLFITEAGSAA